MQTRFLDILAVLGTGRRMTAAELAAEVGASERSVRRDIAELRERGYRIDAAPGAGGGYHAPAGAVLPPLQFSAEEAFALSLALGTLAGQGIGRRSGTPVETALAKLRSVLPPSGSAALDRARHAILASPGNEPEVPLATLADLARAVAEGVLVDLGYRSLRRGWGASAPPGPGASAHRGTGTRRIEPYRIVVFGAHWYLVAYSVDDDAWRTYRLDRIESVHRTTFAFRPRPAPDAVDYVRRQVTESVYPVTVTARVMAPVEEISAHLPARAGTLRRVDDASCELTLGAAGPGWITAFLLDLPAPFTIVEPAGFVGELERTRDALDAVLRTSGGVPSPTTE